MDVGSSLLKEVWKSIVPSKVTTFGWKLLLDGFSVTWFSWFSSLGSSLKTLSSVFLKGICSASDA